MGHWLLELHEAAAQAVADRARREVTKRTIVRLFYVLRGWFGVCGWVCAFGKKPMYNEGGMRVRQLVVKDTTDKRANCGNIENNEKKKKEEAERRTARKLFLALRKKGRIGGGREEEKRERRPRKGLYLLDGNTITRTFSSTEDFQGKNTNHWNQGLVSG